MNIPLWIIQLLFRGNWEAYNLMATLHSPFCNSNCWHCYVDDKLKDVRKELLESQDLLKSFKCLNSDEIYEEFVEFQVHKYKNNKVVNVFRVSGGEPLFLCNLILQLLEKIKKIKKNNDIFVWTETNLFPLINIGDNTSWIEKKFPDFFDEVKKYSNFALHPCIHGINLENMRNITQIKFDESFNYNDFIKFAFTKLIENNIDIYPTFGSNVSPPDKIEDIFYLLKNIHENLPLRIALIGYNVDYSAITNRIKNNFEKCNSLMQVYNKSLVIFKWNNLIQQNYQLSKWEHIIKKLYPVDYSQFEQLEYALIPRHMIPLK